MEKPVNVRKQHYYYLDILNIVATFAVVWLHTSGYAFNFSPSDPKWYLSVFIQVLFIWAVPIFFMISGANLLNYRERYDTKTFLKKRAWRVLLPFISWSVIWYAWNHFIMGNPDWSFKGLINGIEQDQIQPIFWFFYYIIPVYIAMPFLSLLATKANKKVVEYIIWLYIIGTGIINYGYSLIHRPFSQLVSNIPLALSMGIGIFFVGWYLHNFKTSDKQRRIIYGLSCLSVLFMFLFTVFLSIRHGETAREVYNIFSIGGFILPLGIWLFFQHHFPMTWQPNPRIGLWLKRLSGASLGVYVVHEFIIQIMTHVLHISPDSLFHLLGLPLIVWIICLIIILIFKKIPVLNKIIP